MNRAGSWEERGFQVTGVMLATTVSLEALDPQVFQVRSPPPLTILLFWLFDQVITFCGVTEYHHVTVNCLTNLQEFCMSAAQYTALFVSTNKEVNSLNEL